MSQKPWTPRRIEGNLLKYGDHVVINGTTCCDMQALYGILVAIGLSIVQQSFDDMCSDAIKDKQNITPEGDDAVVHPVGERDLPSAACDTVVLHPGSASPAAPAAACCSLLASENKKLKVTLMRKNVRLASMAAEARKSSRSNKRMAA